jgi:hypothetical protein
VKTKKHTTVTITLKTLAALNACGSGVADIAALLPAKISTDPERNIALATTLADADWAKGVTDRVFWLARRLRVDVGSLLTDDGTIVGDNYATQRDACLIMQWLAMIADKIATKAGR